MSVQEVVASLPKVTARSEDICVSGPFPSFTVKGREYTTGKCQLPMAKFLEAKVLNWSTILVGLFDASGNNIREKFISHLDTHGGIKEHIQTYDLHMLPIDIRAKESGRKKCDLPNVTFELMRLLIDWLMEEGKPVIFVDPLYKGTAPTVNILDMYTVYRSLQDMHLKTQLPFTRIKSNDALEVIVYQRGGGNPTPGDMQALTAATGLTRDDVLHVHLTPGKYEQGECTWGGNCYRDFEKSILLILHELNCITPYALAKKKRALYKLWFVLDEFSAYAAYTAVAVQAFGLGEVLGVLCYRQGVYTPM